MVKERTETAEALRLQGSKDKVMIGPHLHSSCMVTVGEAYRILSGVTNENVIGLEQICEEIGIKVVPTENKSLEVCQTMIRVVNKILALNRQETQKSNETREHKI